jgi:hypothetical protein
MPRDPFSQFLKDLISIVKADGTRFDSVQASTTTRPCLKKALGRHPPIIARVF